ncbi:hypothetical protein D1BOALGB6SA_4353 [Olavius sp. associated proteobacterium Delta 1]|nr:hypothetical protein D1BOALGB6SA_4353 [Olavius sp. associated proteobacterium Delta 1]
MKFKYAMAVAWVVGMPFAPINLVVLGNSAGSLGVGFIFLLFLAGAAYILHSRCYADITAFRPGAAGEFDRIADALGPPAAVIFSIFPRALLAVFLATATLAASGFVFNEVFAHRFPNFAFAFLMLGTLLAINLFSRKLSGNVQIFLSGTAAAGLSVLSIAGIYEWLTAGEIVNTAIRIPPLKGSFSVLLLFVGFDLLIFSQNHYRDQASRMRRHLIAGLIIAGSVFCLWGIASLLNVPTARLAKTTIPHIIAAKNILGETGRIIMGLVVISGTGAAVNALLVAVGEMIAGVSRQAPSPFFLQRVFNRSSTIMFLLALVSAAMMALGVAGSDALDTYIRGSLILWLLNYAAIHFTLLLPGAQQTPKASTRLFRWQNLPHGAILMLMLIGSAILIATDDNIGLLVGCLIFIFICVGLPVWLGRRVLSRRRRIYPIVA